MKKRNYKYDNIRAILVILTIFAHFLELFPGFKKLYNFIYIFHMPTLIFISGVFAHFNRQKIIKHLLLPYICFQTAYLFFIAVLNRTDVLLQFTTPYWILWFLFSLICYRSWIPLLFESEGKEKLVECVFLFLITILVSLSAGFNQNIGYLLSLSRTLVFLPFFVAGHYYPRIEEKIQNTLYKVPILKWLFILMAGLGSCYILIRGYHTHLLYGSYSYISCQSTWLNRAVLLATAFNWIAVFLMWTPRNKILLLTEGGSYTMPVFLLHGFIIKLTNYYHLFCFHPILNIILAAFLSLFLFVALGNRWIGGIFFKFF